MSTDERTISNEVNIQEIVDIPIGGKKNVILDATVLSTLMSCPRLTDFRFNHNLQAIGGKSNSLETGSIVHKFLEVYYGSIIKGVNRADAVGFGMAAASLYIQGCKDCTEFEPIRCPNCGGTGIDNEGVSEFIAGPCKTCNETGKITKPKCNHKPNDYPGVINTPKDSDSHHVGWQWALDTCQMYVDHYRNDHWIPLETEVVKAKVLYEDDEVRVMWKAKLDWVVDTNQGIYPVDHKTMKQNRKTTTLNNQFIGQCLMMSTRNMFINKIGFQTSLKPAEKFIRETKSYSSARLFEWQSEILPYYAKLLIMYAESGYFPPNYSHCESKYGLCAFANEVCSSDPDMREETIKLHFKVGPEWNPTNDDE